MFGEPGAYRPCREAGAGASGQEGAAVGDVRPEQKGRAISGPSKTCSSKKGVVSFLSD